MRQPSSASLRIAILCAAMIAAPAFAHPGHSHAATGFSSGFLHPLTGLDHLLAMLAVGLWAGQQRKLAWSMLALFPLMMIAGALLAFGGMDLPMVEPGIAASVLVLGLLVAFAVRMPAVAGAAVVSFFALFHGYAHGSELPAGASALAYGAGFVIATLLLHLGGLGVGRTLQNYLLRACGAGAAMAGAYLLTLV